MSANGIHVAAARQITRIREQLLNLLQVPRQSIPQRVDLVSAQIDFASLFCWAFLIISLNARNREHCAIDC